MTNPKMQSSEQRVDDPRPKVQEQTAKPAQKEQTRTHFVDPYDMRAEPPPEEPGYGHGV